MGRNILKQVRMSGEEWAVVEKAVGEYGTNFSAWVRMKAEEQVGARVKGEEESLTPHTVTATTGGGPKAVKPRPAAVATQGDFCRECSCPSGGKWKYCKNVRCDCHGEKQQVAA